MSNAKAAVVVESEDEPGLRERKKRALRGELSLAAGRLAKELGLEKVRTEDIVAAVGVSRRTFNNYFANKYEAIADRHLERTQQSAEALRLRPPGETLWKALTAALLGPYEVWADSFRHRSAEERQSLRLVVEHPDLRAAMAKGEFAAQQTLMQAIAERTGTDASEDVYPALVAATALAAMATVRDRWLKGRSPPPLVPMLREALQQLEQGLPEPSRRKR